MMYMPFVLLGVVFITFVLFQMSTTPEALARIQLGEKASERVVYEWLVANGHASWTDAGRAKQQEVITDNLPRQATPFFVDEHLNRLQSRADTAQRRLERTAERLARRIERSGAEDDRSAALRGELAVRTRELAAARINLRETLASARALHGARHLNTPRAVPVLKRLEALRLDMDWALTDAARLEEFGLDASTQREAFETAFREFAGVATPPPPKPEVKDPPDPMGWWLGYLPLRHEIGGLADIPPDLTYTPWYRAFAFYVRDIARLDFGKTNSGRRVTEVIRQGIGPSLKLMLPAFLIAELIGVFFGLMAAIYRQTRIDHAIVVSAILLMSINSIALVMYGQKYLAADLHYAPISGYESGFGAARFLFLPLFLYVLLAFGERVRFARIVMLDETNQDYVRTARAKGLGENRVLFKHILRNTLIPLITRWVVAIPTLYLGSLVLETFFGIPGLGRLTIDAVNNSDANVIRAVVVIGSVGFMLANLLSDVLYAVVDPRVRLE
jgi:peptide/nickel transport system permease protein